jgi:hypothetical protein
MTLAKAEQAIINGIYAAAAWLILDLGQLFQQHRGQTFSILLSQTELLVGVVIAIACIVGLFYKSRLAAMVLFLVFLIPLVLRMAQGAFPSSMYLLFSLILLYFFYAAVLGTFSYHHLKQPDADAEGPD